MSYDSDVINATSGRGEANWDLIIKLCNRIRDSVGPSSMAQAMSSVLKRVKHSDPNVQLHALTLLEACVSNCGKSFQEELTKSAFQNEFKSIITGSYADPRVTQRCKDLLVSWATEFKTTPGMSGLMRFVDQLKKDGISFQGLPIQQQQPPGRQVPTSTAASSEDADLKRAIELSLRDSSNSGPTSAPPPSTGSFYPSLSPAPVKKDAKKVRAIYDFEAAEDNELSFRAGEIITLLDDSDENWWRGQTQLGTGLFPASFVSKNLKVDPEPSQAEVKESKKGKSSRKSEKKAKKKVTVNTEKIDLLLDMIKGADVTSEENLAENETLVELEDECKKMRPLVDGAIAELQKKEEKMQAINGKFEEALALYRKLLAEGPRLGSVANQQVPASSGAAPVITNPVPSVSKGPLPQSAVPYASFMQQPPPSTVGSGHQLTQLPPAPGHTLPPITGQLPPPPPYSSAVPEMGSLYTDPSATASFQPQHLSNGYTSNPSMLSDPGASVSYSMTQPQSLHPGTLTGLQLQQPQQSLTGNMSGPIPGSGSNHAMMGGAPSMISEPQHQAYNSHSNLYQVPPSQPPLL